MVTIIGIVAAMFGVLMIAFAFGPNLYRAGQVAKWGGVAALVFGLGWTAFDPLPAKPSDTGVTKVVTRLR